MNKHARFFSAFVAFALLLVSGPLPAAARMRAQIGGGSGAMLPVMPAIGGGVQPVLFSNALTPAIGLNGSFAPAPLASAVPAAAATPGVAQIFAELQPGLPGAMDAAPNWSNGGGFFDGSSEKASGIQFVNLNLGPYGRPNYNERNKINAALRYGAAKSPVLSELNSEFEKKGGYYVIDANQSSRYMAAAAVDSERRPVILLTYDLLNRYNGRAEDVYRGAPWEFIASMIAREQIFFSNWYGAIPASAEKLAVSFMNMTRVFVDLTNGTSRSWAADKDFQAVPNDRSSYVQWRWFEQLVIAARAAALGASTNSGHLIDSKFFSWLRDFTAHQDKSSVPAFQYSLWEQFDGKYYRPGDAKNGSFLPPNAPRIDKATYDSASYTVYGADGKGNARDGGLDAKTVYGWIIQWLQGRREI